LRRIYFSFILLVLVWNLTAFQNNETLIYDIKYGMITAGESSLSIEESTYKDSIDIYRILSIAKTNSFFDNVFKVRDKIESIWRKDDMQSLRFTKKLKEGKYRQHKASQSTPNLDVKLKKQKRKGWKSSLSHRIF